MPRYDYYCSNRECPYYDFNIERIVKNKEEKIKCPICDSTMERQFPFDATIMKVIPSESKQKAPRYKFKDGELSEDKGT